MDHFQLKSTYTPKGDQPKVIEALTRDIVQGAKHRVLLGVTGSGKTFTMANVIERLNRPALVLAHNKTLAAQLYLEFKELFPDNFVGYFVSYYDYYQPESYLPATDTYIEKDSAINDEIDRMRHAATFNLLNRRDVIIVCSVSCIYGIGAVENYSQMVIAIKIGQKLPRKALIKQLVQLQYTRNDIDFDRGTFRVRGEIVDIIPVYEEKFAYRFQFFDDEVEQIYRIDPLTGEVDAKLSEITLFAASHYVTPPEKLNAAIGQIREELRDRIQYFRGQNKLLEAQRIEQRTQFDLEMIEEMGYCSGIENYSRYLDGRKAGQAPTTLIDYFPKDFTLFIDESHVTVSQVGAMYMGDRSRKTTLVEYGFRLPSALDNRPLNFEEFLLRLNQAVYVSATPREYEIEKSDGVVYEQIIRPTGLIDPMVEIQKTRGQMDHLKNEIEMRAKINERTLVTTLTKRMAEDLTEFFKKQGIRVEYLHSDIKTIERTEILNALRAGEFDCLVGINLLREGLDLPEVSLVAILDADKEGFLRSSRSLIQTFGRAARHASGKVILYADKMTDAMKQAISETSRRREIQLAYNRENNITPQSISKKISKIRQDLPMTGDVANSKDSFNKLQIPKDELDQILAELQKKMMKAAENLQFEDAAKLRDRLILLKERSLLEND
jgi:excinuclease ABC subunit B